MQIFIPFPYPLLFYIFYRPTFPANFPQKITFFANCSTVLWWYLAFRSFTTTCLFFKAVLKVRFFAIWRITILPYCWIGHLLERNGIHKAYLPAPLFIWLDIYIYTGVTVVKAFRGWYTFCINAWSITVYLDISKYICLFVVKAFTGWWYTSFIFVYSIFVVYFDIYEYSSLVVVNAFRG